MKFLRYSITPDGIQPRPDKVQMIASFPLAKTVKDVPQAVFVDASDIAIDAAP